MEKNRSGLWYTIPLIVFLPALLMISWMFLSHARGWSLVWADYVVLALSLASGEALLLPRLKISLPLKIAVGAGYAAVYFFLLTLLGLWIACRFFHDCI